MYAYDYDYDYGLIDEIFRVFNLLFYRSKLEFQ